MKRLVVMLMVVGLLSVQAQALYVDAAGGTGGNTVLASDGSDNWWVAAQATDGLWDLRTGFAFDDSMGLGGDIYQGRGTNNPDDAPLIITTASGLTAGQLYKVEVVFWSPYESDQNWTIRAGFDAGSMILFDDATGGSQPGSVPGELMGIREGNRDAYTGLIGTIAADSNGQIAVYIDDLPALGHADRTWYDGVQLTAIPEPATMVLLGLGAVLLRRKK